MDVDDGGDIRVSDATSARRANRRVLIYGINYSPEPIGVGRYTGDIAGHLLQQGAQVTVVTAIPHYPGWAPRDGYLNWYRAESLSGVQVFRCPLVLKTEMSGIWRLVAPLSFAVASAPVAIWKILTMRPTTIVCVEPTLFSAPIALLFAKLIGARTVLHVQDMEIDAAFAVGYFKSSLIQKLALMYEKFVLRRFDAVITISQSMERKLRDKGVAAETLSVVRNWVDLGKIKALAKPSSYRAELGIPENRFVALYAGNIGRKQALDLILQAADELASRCQIDFVIAGDGPEKKRFVETFGKLPNVFFLPIQPEERLCDLLNLADVHLLPQQAGTADLVLPSKLGGMLASGKPCIVMADPGTELYEFLDGAVNLIPTGNLDVLVRALEHMAEADDTTAPQRSELAQRLRADHNLKFFADILLG